MPPLRPDEPASPPTRLRLLVVVNVFHPDRGGGAAVFSDLCAALVERGHEVTVRCAYPYYPEWRDKSGRNGWRIERSMWRGVNLERYGLFIPRNPNALAQRLLYEGSFFLSLLRSLPRSRGFDAVMVYCPLVGAVAFAGLQRWFSRAPLWLNVQDLSADAAAASGISRVGFVNGLLARIQNFLFNRAGVWSSISPVMIARLRQIRRRNQPILFLPNWLNASLGEEIERLPDKVGREPAEPVRLLYAGNIGTKQDLLRFCRALHESDAPFMFRIHGNGGEAERVRAWVEASGDLRFGFGAFLEEPDFARALHETDFFVITEKSGSGGSFIPSKMIPGMASGTPILAVSDPDSPLGREMRTARPGPFFTWSELGAVPPVLKAPSSAEAPFAAWQRRAVAHARTYDRRRVIDGFEQALRTVAAGRIPPELPAPTTPIPLSP